MCACRYDERLQDAKETANQRGATVSLSLGVVYFLIFVCYSIGFWYEELMTLTLLR